MKDKKQIERKIRLARKQITEIDEKRSELTSLIGKLESQLDHNDLVAQGAKTGTSHTALNFTDDDIELFMKLFTGRQDVFPKRWENRKGRSGYSPACRNEWVSGVCEKPRVKCTDCDNQDFIPLTPEIIRDHLNGRITIGIYPLLKDEACCFLAIDFDKENWMNDVSSFIETCKKKNISCGVERSRSGKGAHIWFFFENPISSHIARRFGCALLTETMEHRHQVGLSSYDRLFPSQDTIPKGGFGNLIALPFQADPIKKGNSLFVDSNFDIYPDQWSFLRSIKPLTEEFVRTIEEQAAQQRRIIGVRMSMDDDMSEQPWMVPPSGYVEPPKIQGKLPDQIEIVRSGFIFIEKTELPSGLINRIIRLAAFQNPEFYHAQAMRLSTFNKPRIISCSEELEKHIAVPRGCFEELMILLKKLNIKVKIDDKRNVGKVLNVKFNGTLLQEQEESVARLLSYDIGVLSAPTAFGKTVVGAKLIAERKVNTLILVHRKHLLDQWRGKLNMFLNIEENRIGQIGGGKKKVTNDIDIAMLQSLNRKGVIEDLVAEYGQVIVDECHHIPAFTFESVLRQIRAKYVVGLTATPTRKDGHHPIIFMQCGPIRYAINPRKAAKERMLEHKVFVRKTTTQIDIPENQIKINDIYNAILEDTRRTEMIAKDVHETLKRGRSPLILTERRDHLEKLAEKLMDLGNCLFILHGGVREKKRLEILDEFRNTPEDKPRVLLATGKYIGEGFDDARLDTLFLTSPISWKGILQQYAGRLHRSHHAKIDVIIYDYVDMNIPMARRMFERRKKGYVALGYHLEDPSQTTIIKGWDTNFIKKESNKRNLT